MRPFVTKNNVLYQQQQKYVIWVGTLYTIGRYRNSTEILSSISREKYDDEDNI